MEKSCKELWRIFYQSEQELLQEINAQCDCLYSSTGNELGYIEFMPMKGLTLFKPPKFIHWIGKLKTDGILLKDQLEIVKNNYLLAVGEKNFKKFPIRFPVFYQDIEQINITTHRAFSSRKSKDNEITVKRYWKPKEEESFFFELIDADFIKLKTANMHPSLVEEDRYFDLKINIENVVKLKPKEFIQVRINTGDQYRATIRYTGKSRGLRSPLGLMIIDMDSKPSVVRPAPEAPRLHSLSAKGNRIHLPIDTPYELYIK